MTDPFQKLGIPTSSSAIAIKRAYRSLAKSCHPDLREDKELATIEFRELTRIYEAALAMALKPVKTKKPPPPPPPKPAGPITANIKVAAMDEFEFTLFGEVTRFAFAPPEIFEYGGSVSVHVGVNGFTDKMRAWKFEVPPKTKNGQKFRFKLPIGIVELTLVSQRK